MITDTHGFHRAVTDCGTETFSLETSPRLDLLKHPQFIRFTCSTSELIARLRQMQSDLDL